MQSGDRGSLQTIRELREYATLTSNISLHLMCSSIIDMMLAEGCHVPWELCIYARLFREYFGTQDDLAVGTDPARALV